MMEPLLWSQPPPIQRSPIAYLLHSALTVDFTCGIATTIFASQLEDLSGLTFSGVEHGPLFPKLVALGHALPKFTPSCVLLRSLSFGCFTEHSLAAANVFNAPKLLTYEKGGLR